MKLNKPNLKRDTVSSPNFHVGIELELVAPGEGGSHDYESCTESQRDYFESIPNQDILRYHLGLSRESAENVSPYFNSDQWVNDRMNDWSCDGDCSFQGDGGIIRQDLQNSLTRLTGNKSFKVVEDGSIETNGDGTDAEVCWNYYASKETLKDNKIILDYLSKGGCEFNTSCGLHINLNNYLHVPACYIPRHKLDFLFDFVAPSRRDSNYCNNYGMTDDQKYSMIYHQGDRLEFRFFSPTLEADKLNQYVALANVVYRRLAGKPAKLSKKAEAYFLQKIKKTHKVSLKEAQETIDKLNYLPSAEALKQENQVA